MGQNVLREDINNRMAFHPADTDLKRQAHETARTLSIAHARAMMDLLPEGREKSLCATALQEALMWANASIAINGGPREHLVADDLDAMVADFGASYGNTYQEGSRPL